MMLHKRVLYALLFPLINYSVFAVNPNEEKVKSLVEKYCSPTVQESKFTGINSILQKLTPVTINEGIKVLDYILPQACFRDYPVWLLDRTINLAIYAYHDGRLKPDTLKYMNELIPSMSVGKEDYIFYGIMLENLLSAGLDKEYIFDIFYNALNESYNPAGTEALIYYYIISAQENKNHRQALSFALSESKSYKSQERSNVLNHLFYTDDEINKNRKGLNQEKLKVELEEKYNQFWKKNKHKIKLHEKFVRLESKLKTEEMAQVLNGKIGAPYAYRQNKDYGTDVNGMIALITKSRIEDLPYKYNSYCSSETINMISNMKTGDVLLFSSEAGHRDATAMGIYLNNEEFLYVTISKGVVKASLKDIYYKNTLMKGCRIIK